MPLSRQCRTVPPAAPAPSAGLPTLALVAAALALAGCGQADTGLYPPADTTPPQVVGSFPAAGWHHVPLGVTPRVWFSEPLEPATVVQGNLGLSSGAYHQHCRLRTATEPDGRGRVDLLPERPLLPGVRYRLWLNRGITDRAGNPLPAAVQITFDTIR